MPRLTCPRDLRFSSIFACSLANVSLYLTGKSVSFYRAHGTIAVTMKLASSKFNHFLLLLKLFLILTVVTIEATWRRNVLRRKCYQNRAFYHILTLRLLYFILIRCMS